MPKTSLFILCFFFYLSGSSHGGVHDNIIKICGSGDNQELLRQLARSYESRYPGSRIEVPDSIGSSGGVKATATGQCDIGRLARPLRAKEKRYGLNWKLFARSPVVFLVSANLDNISNITAQQVVRIFMGRMTSWQEMGGPAEKIYIANREKGDSSRTVIEKYLIDFSLISTQVGKTLYSTPETIATVADHDNTIAYGPLSSTIKRRGIRVLAFEGVLPSVQAISEGHYPLVSEFGLVWRHDVSAHALAFIKFLDTEEAHGIILRHGAVFVAPENK